jgi:hypothetical protein
MPLCVLIGPLAIADRSAQPGDPKPGGILDPAIDADAALGAHSGAGGREPQPHVVRRPQRGVMVAGDIEKGDVRAGDQILEVVEWQVTARDDEVRLQLLEGVALESLGDLIRDCEHARHLHI